MDYKIEKFATLSSVQKRTKSNFFSRRKWNVRFVPTDQSYTAQEMVDILNSSEYPTMSGRAFTEKGAYRQIEKAKKRMKATFDWTRSD
jgi:hypothetical protein